MAAIICALAARGQVSQAQTPYTKIFYNSGPLRIEAYLYMPPGKGSFPLIISNHGQYPARQDRIEIHTVPRTSELLTAAGYAVVSV
jgi:dienelactone hydrolase